MVPRSEPWQALVAGVQAGSQIRASIYRNQALQLQADQQAQQDVLRMRELELRREQMTLVNQARLEGMEDRQANLADVPLLNQFAKDPSGEMPQFRSPASFAVAGRIAENWSKTKAGQAWQSSQKVFWDRAAEISGGDQALLNDMFAESKGQITSDIYKFVGAAYERRPPKETSAITNARETTRLRRMADQIRATDPAKADELLQEAAQIEAVALGANETTEMTTDASGRPIYRVTKGPNAGKGAIGGPTVANQTRLQQDIGNTVDLLDIVGDLKENLQWKDVGAAGVAGEWVLDRFLPQFGANTADVGRMDRRTKLKTLAQGSLRQISPDNRFTNEDRQRVEEIVPSSGIFESEQHARQALATIGRVFARRNVRDRIQLGQTLEMPKLDNEEIAAAVELKVIPYAEAFEFLKTHR